MPTFILRAIDPDLWARVTAKAAADGLTVKQLVLKALAQYVALVVLLVLTTACGAPNPTQATPLPPAAAVPASITVTSLAGVGTSIGQVYLSATVTDASGKGVGAAVVHFTTTAGTFAVTPVTTDGGGLAQASLTTTGPATITASVGAVTSSLAVAPTPAPVELPPYVPLPTPPIVPPVVAPPVVPPVVLSVSVVCTAEAHGTPTVCNVAVSYGATAIDSSVVTRLYVDWGDGQDETFLNSPLASYSYRQAGTYRIGMTAYATTVDGTKTATATTSVIVL